MGYIEIIALELRNEVVVSGSLNSETKQKSIHYSTEEGFTIGDNKEKVEQYLVNCFERLKDIALNNDDGRARVWVCDDLTHII